MRNLHIDPDDTGHGEPPPKDPPVKRPAPTAPVAPTAPKK